MKKGFIWFISVLFWCSAGLTYPDFLETYVKQNGLDACVLIENAENGEKHVFNGARSRQAFLPASTFKILNTLIALKEGAVKNESEIIKWDGTDKGFPEWNRDQNILSAFPASCVWFYQELAKRIGDRTYRRYLEKLHYGNGKTGKPFDTFWLSGDLRITPQEQLGFIRNIYYEKYDFSSHSYEVLKKLMIIERTDTWTLRAKTGMTMRVSPQIAWYVGYLETADDVWLFVCNFELTQRGDERFRRELVMQAFRELGIIGK
ncbi:MAG: class D beta-lactamase [Spirochaetales bacterium]|nr:class D beta-lactamase [Spirochaetales bacterium]